MTNQELLLADKVIRDYDPEIEEFTVASVDILNCDIFKAVKVIYRTNQVNQPFLVIEAHVSSRGKVNRQKTVVIGLHSLKEMYQIVKDEL